MSAFTSSSVTGVIIGAASATSSMVSGLVRLIASSWGLNFAIITFAIRFRPASSEIFLANIKEARVSKGISKSSPFFPSVSIYFSPFNLNLIFPNVPIGIVFSPPSKLNFCGVAATGAAWTGTTGEEVSSFSSAAGANGASTGASGTNSGISNSESSVNVK